MSYLQHKRSSYGDGSSVGIVCECCTSRCSLSETAQYCKSGGGYLGKRASWGAPTPPHAWDHENTIKDEQQADNDELNDDAIKDKNKKITEVILFTMFPDRKATTNNNA